ncbi:hypothetical protein KDW_10090 [Dictyobacter vulcani]|uniref:Uncharacterized protein n=1 Tax=Dictyobacter vulcani TaxID=2607529 RepID=A0A5J4KK90_9CHLR|nr:hypothetical protein [Dictyobacter vulcani]GER86847.1 hypothetical protein KDW_10090 [Dictyobacter vulcani]
MSKNVETHVQAIAIFGLDFTSAPSLRKPITCMCCQLESTTLIVEDSQLFPDFTTL